MKRDLEKAQRESEAEKKREAELVLAGVPAGERGPDNVPDAPKPSIFKRMSGMFAGLRKKAERESARGK